MNTFVRLAGYVLLPAVLVASSCGSSDGFMTLGSSCSTIGGRVCDREIACGNLTTSQRSDCLTEFQGGCCQTDGTCSERVMTQQDETALETIINDCSTALMTFDCAALAAGDSPVACGGYSTSYVAARVPSLQTGVTVSSPRQLGAIARHRLAPR